MRFSVFVPEQAAGSPLPRRLLPRRARVHRADLRHQGRAPSVSPRRSAWCWSPATPARAAARYPGDDASWDFGQGASFYVDATEEPWRQSYRMDSYVTRELPARRRAAFPRRCPACAASSGTRWAATARWRWRCATRGCYRSVSAFAPVVAPSQVPWGQKAFAGYLGAAPRRVVARTTPASSCARGRCPISMLIDVGTADKFLERELKPELFEAACAEAGQKLELRRQRRLRPQLLLHRDVRRRPPRAPRRGR